MTGDRGWRVRLAAAAEEDFRDIVRWTAARFGEAQARLYADTLTRAIDALKDGSHVTGARLRNDIAEGLMAIHVARRGRKGRHLVFFRVASPTEPPTIDVLRLLHDSMDPVRHLVPGKRDEP